MIFDLYMQTHLQMHLQMHLQIYADLQISLSKLQIYNYGRDVSAGNFKPMVVNSSAEQIVALSAVDNAVLDTIATNTANINVNVGKTMKMRRLKERGILRDLGKSH